MTDPLVVTNLKKQYKTKHGTVNALNGVSFSVKKGEIFGLLGPNGAGKTTTINILTGLLTADSGTTSYFGQPFGEDVQNKINVSRGYSYLNGTLTVEQNLRVYAKMYDVKDPTKKIHTLLKSFGIADLKDRQVYELSSGQRTRVNLCKALVNDPELLFLDEATAGLDPDIAVDVRSVIKKLPTTIVFTSHIMQEIEELCDRVAFVKRGQVLAIDKPSSLKKKLGKKTLEEVFLHLTKHA